MKSQKFGKIALAASIALGGTFAYSQLNAQTVEASSIEGVWESNGYYSSPSKDVLRAKLVYWAEDETGTPNRNPRFTIKNTSGKIVHSGSLNSFRVTSKTPDFIDYESLTNISTSSLPAGKYRINLTIVMDDGTIDVAGGKNTLTQHFEILPNRTITNFAD